MVIFSQTEHARTHYSNEHDAWESHGI